MRKGDADPAFNATEEVYRIFVDFPEFEGGGFTGVDSSQISKELRYHF